MAHVPVNFDLHDFQLSLNTQQSAKFHGRMKELGFNSVQQGDTLIYQRGKSRITAFVVNGAALNFLPDFFDDTPGGTVYAIMEKMCVAFGGTMIGKYTIDGVNNQWDVRISQGMNLSGKADVGKREHVVDENAAGGATPSSRPQSSGGQSAQTSQASPQRTGQGSGEVGDGQSGESTRDKLYRVLVEEAYQKYVEEHGANPNQLITLIKHFNQQFPKEEQEEQETEEEKKIRALFIEHLGMESSVTNKTLYREIKLLEDNDESVLMNVADELGIDEVAVEDYFSKLNQ